MDCGPTHGPGLGTLQVPTVSTIYTIESVPLHFQIFEYLRFHPLLARAPAFSNRDVFKPIYRHVTSRSQPKMLLLGASMISSVLNLTNYFLYKHAIRFPCNQNKSMHQLMLYLCVESLLTQVLQSNSTTISSFSPQTPTQTS